MCVASSGQCEAIKVVVVVVVVARLHWSALVETARNDGGGGGSCSLEERREKRAVAVLVDLCLSLLIPSARPKTLRSTDKFREREKEREREGDTADAGPLLKLVQYISLFSDL